MESTRKYFYYVKNSKLYLPILALLAFTISYFLFYPIIELEKSVINSHFLLPAPAYFQAILIEQIILYVLAFTFFIISNKFWLTFFIYAGFLFQYIKIEYWSYLLNMEHTILWYQFPVFVYSISVVFILVGFKFSKKISLVALLLSITFLGIYNYLVLTTHFNVYIEKLRSFLF